MNQMKRDEPILADTAMKKICFWSWLKNNLFGGLNRQIGFIWVQSVHLFGQLLYFLRFSMPTTGHLMNQMNLVVLMCCLWQQVYFYRKVIRDAMNLGRPLLHQGSLIGG